jgi:hypothetical protein
MLACAKLLVLRGSKQRRSVARYQLPFGSVFSNAASHAPHQLWLRITCLTRERGGSRTSYKRSSTRPIRNLRLQIYFIERVAVAIGAAKIGSYFRNASERQADSGTRN